MDTRVSKEKGASTNNVKENWERYCTGRDKECWYSLGECHKISPPLGDLEERRDLMCHYGSMAGPWSMVIVGFSSVFPAMHQGRSQDFTRGGGITLCQSKGTSKILVSFSPPVVGCLLKKGLKGGSRAPGAPLATPLPSFPHSLKFHLSLRCTKNDCLSRFWPPTLTLLPHILSVF